jgi:signal transduction histidine kinase
VTRRLNYSGLVIAGVGFFLTRFTVTLAIYEDPVRFYLAGVVPLLLGLGLAAFGVALVVADVDASLVRTTARWCVVGAGGMLVLVVLTLLGSTPGGVPGLDAVRSQTYLSNFLIGGSVGGTLTGLYASRNRRQHSELQQQANRLEVLNRMLRHEVLNSVNIIRGYATLDRDTPDAREIIAGRSDDIEGTIEQVTYLTWSAKTSRTSPETVDLGACLRASAEAVREQYPHASIAVDSEGPSVRANDRLEQVFTNLIENAVVHATGETPTVAVTVETTATSVRVGVHDDGDGLPEPQQALLETGEITEFDDPRDGYGLNVVRLLVESFGGAIETTVTVDGTTITVVLSRPGSRAVGVESTQAGLAGVRPSVPHLGVILGAAVLAGVPYGIVSEQLGGSIAAIGVFYGVNDPVVGWLTHEFHSAVFGFVFAGLVSFLPARYRNHVPAYVVLGAAWGACLWAVAAGVVAPVWLNLLGIPAPLPTLSPELLVSHLVWGVSLGVLTALGYRYVTPRLARLTARRGVDAEANRPTAR